MEALSRGEQECGDAVLRCHWCGRPVPTARTGRPRRYCTDAHRQRAYAARRRARELGLGEGEVVVSVAQLRSVQARMEVLREALAGVSVALTSSTGTRGYRDALRVVRDSVADLDTFWLEPEAADEEGRH